MPKTDRIDSRPGRRRKPGPAGRALGMGDAGEIDATGRPLLVCPEPACREQGVPMLYAQNYAQMPALPFSIVGLRGHGKTVFLTSLFHEFDDLGRRWPGFYWAALDEEGMREVRQ